MVDPYTPFLAHISRVANTAPITTSDRSCDDRVAAFAMNLICDGNRQVLLDYKTIKKRLGERKIKMSEGGYASGL